MRISQEKEPFFGGIYVTQYQARPPGRYFYQGNDHAPPATATNTQARPKTALSQGIPGKAHGKAIFQE